MTNSRVKLIFPPRFEIYNPYFAIYDSSRDLLPNFIPYGMSVLTYFLRQHNFYVEQDDLSIKFNRYKGNFFTGKPERMDLDIVRNRKDLNRFFRYGKTNRRLDLLVDKILNSTSIKGFDIIGFSLVSIKYFPLALLLAKRIKEKTSASLVLGGPFITLYGHLYPEAFRLVDYMIADDGRIPLLKLINALKEKTPLSEVPNLIYSNQGKLVHTFKERYPIEDIPIPDFDGLSLELYKNPAILPYQISRGCINRCVFCNSRAIDSRVEYKSYSKVLGELSLMKRKYNTSSFCFCDDSINTSYEYLDGLCKLLIQEKLDIKWIVYTTIKNIDINLLRKMKAAGCYALKFGIESGSDRLLRAMKKDFTAQQASIALRYSHEEGIMNDCLFMAGYPYETKEDINKTIEFIKQNMKSIDYFYIQRFRLLYGSAIYLNPSVYGIENLFPSNFRAWFAFNETYGLKWKEKLKQQIFSERVIFLALYKNIVIKKRYKKIIQVFLATVASNFNVFLKNNLRFFVRLWSSPEKVDTTKSWW